MNCLNPAILLKNEYKTLNLDALRIRLRTNLNTIHLVISIVISVLRFINNLISDTQFIQSYNFLEKQLSVLQFGSVVIIRVQQTETSSDVQHRFGIQTQDRSRYWPLRYIETFICFYTNKVFSFYLLLCFV